MDTVAVPTYEEILENPDIILGWDDQALLLHFLGTRFIIMTETGITSNRDRLSRAIKVGRIEYQEILRRMAEGRSEPPF